MKKLIYASLTIISILILWDFKEIIHEYAKTKEGWKTLLQISSIVVLFLLAWILLDEDKPENNEQC